MEYSFNNQSFDIEIEIRNDKNSVKLTQNGFEELSFEEDLFNWEISGHLVMSNRYEMFRKNPDENSSENPNTFYKFLGNGQDIISIRILPKLYSSAENQNKQTPSIQDLPFEQWGIQFEATIFDVEDMGGDGEHKKLKLLFVEHAMVSMMNKNLDFSTVEMATEGMDDEEVIKMDNYERSLKIGDAVYSLLKKADFEKYLKNYGTKKWNVGDDKNKIFYTSPSTHTVVQDLVFLNSIHTSDVEHKYEPCFFMFDRNKEVNKPKQFSITPISEFFKKAGTSSPLEYTVEDFTIVNVIQHDKPKVVSTPKSPITTKPSTTVGVKAIEYSDIKTYEFLENQTFRNITDFNNKLPVSFNPIDGQFNFEKVENTSEEVRKYLEDNYVSLLKNQDKKSRIVLNKDIKSGVNSEIFSTILRTREARYAVGRNKLLMSMMFNSMGISFSARGLTIRQPARFINVSKNGEINNKDFDHRIEGQYFITNVKHVFSASESQYTTDLHAVKFHVYAEQFNPDEDKDNSKL
jgi:hypothetical protein